MSCDSIKRLARVSLIPVFALTLMTGSALAQDESKGQDIAKGSDCFSCHAVDHKVVGPAFQDVAKKFAGDASAPAMLVDAVQKGHVGTWGSIPMPAHPALYADDAKQIITWILSLKPADSASAAPATAEAPVATASGKTYDYTVNGKQVASDVEIFQPGSTSKVTKTVFHGFETYNSYCFRCHGEDAVGGTYAPNLRQSLTGGGMTEAQFTNVAMVGRKDKGMPSWAGFFSPDQIHEVYAYVKARALGAVGDGTPPE